MAQEEDASPESPTGAMQKALAAEKQAREAVRGCEQQAETLREQARERARRISARTEQRINWVHNHCARELERRLAEMVVEDEGEDTAPAGTDPQLLDEAVRQLARRLTTGSGTAPSPGVESPE
jgi:hypothetical protein